MGTLTTTGVHFGGGDGERPNSSRRIAAGLPCLGVYSPSVSFSAVFFFLLLSSYLL